MKKKKKSVGPTVNGSHRKLEPLKYEDIERMKRNTGVSMEYIKKCEEIHRKNS